MEVEVKKFSLGLFLYFKLDSWCKNLFRFLGYLFFVINNNDIFFFRCWNRLNNFYFLLVVLIVEVIWNCIAYGWIIGLVGYLDVVSRRDKTVAGVSVKV